MHRARNNGFDILGIGVAPAAAVGGSELWRALPAMPAPAASGAGLLALDAALADADCSQPDARVRLYVCGNSLSGSDDRWAPAQRFSGASLLPALERATAALLQDDCDRAAIVALASAGASKAEHGAAIVLGRAGDHRPAGGQLYATLRAVHCFGRADDADVARRIAGVCQQTNIDPRSIALLSARGGRDAGLLLALADHLRREEPLPHCQLGPHFGSSALAGMWSLLAAALALHQHLLPPSSDGDLPPAHPYVTHPGVRPWLADPRGTPRRAGIIESNGESDGPAGTGGERGFVLLEQAPWECHVPPPRLDLPWPLELLLLGSDDRSRLVEMLQAVRARAVEPGAPPLRALVERSSRAVTAGRHRAALVVRDAAMLVEKVDRLCAWLVTEERPLYQTPDGIFYADTAGLPAGKTAFLYPGQGSPYLGMLSDLCIHVPEVQVWFERLQASCEPDEKCPTALLISPPLHGLSGEHRRLLSSAILAMRRGGVASLIACLSLHWLLEKLGLRADLMAGYSNGENAALIASGIWRFDSLDRLYSTLAALRRGDVLESSGEDIPHGTSVAVSRAPRGLVDEIVAGAHGEVLVSLDNCPDQLVLYGSPAATGKAILRLREAGAVCTEIPFSRGYHTPFYAARVRVLREVYRDFRLGPGRVPLYSCATADRFPDEREAIGDLATLQWERPVKFQATIERLYADGARNFVEIGPNALLTGFVRSTLRGRRYLAVPSNLPGRPALEQLLRLLAQLYVHGQDVDLTPLGWTSERRRAMPVLWSQPEPPVPPAPAQDAQTHLAGDGDGDDGLAHYMPIEVPSKGGGAGLQSSLRHRIFEGHAALMAQFLDSQRRVNALFARGLGEIEGAVADAWLAASAGDELPRVAHDQAAARPAGGFPMLGDDVRVDGGYLRTRRVVSRASDPFVVQHAFGERFGDHGADRRALPVVPFTFSMEVVAEAARRLLEPGEAVCALRRLCGRRWLALDGDALPITIEAQRDSTERGSEIRVHVFEGELAERRWLAFEGVAEVGREVAAVPGPVIAPIAPNRSAPRVQSPAFNAFLFHGPLYKSMRRVVAAGPEGIEVEVVAPPLVGLFAEQPAPALDLPANLLDVAGQLLALWLMESGRDHFGAFPVRVAAYLQPAPMPGPGSVLRVRARPRLDGMLLMSDVEILDLDGRLLARFEAFEMRVYDFEPHQHALLFGGGGARLSQPTGADPDQPQARTITARDIELLGGSQGIWLRVISQLFLDEDERRAFQALPEGPAGARWLLSRILAREVLTEDHGVRPPRRHARTVEVEPHRELSPLRAQASGEARDAAPIRAQVHVHASAQRLASEVPALVARQSPRALEKE